MGVLLGFGRRPPDLDGDVRDAFTSRLFFFFFFPVPLQIAMWPRSCDVIVACLSLYSVSNLITPSKDFAIRYEVRDVESTVYDGALPRLMHAL